MAKHFSGAGLIVLAMALVEMVMAFGICRLMFQRKLFPRL
jgi:hypothetical protein